MNWMFPWAPVIHINVTEQHIIMISEDRSNDAENTVLISD